eukprot:4043651-Alexandrium_andersonii.AAC.1
MGSGGPAVVEHDGDLASGPLELTLARGEQWFIRVAQGGVVTLAGAGETATAPAPAAAWVKVAGPAADRNTADWLATRSVQVRVEGAQRAWAAVSHEPLRGPQACRRRAPDTAGCMPPDPSSTEAWRGTAQE